MWSSSWSDSNTLAFLGIPIGIFLCFFISTFHSPVVQTTCKERIILVDKPKIDPCPIGTHIVLVQDLNLQSYVICSCLSIDREQGVELPLIVPGQVDPNVDITIPEDDELITL